MTQTHSLFRTTGDGWVGFRSVSKCNAVGVGKSGWNGGVEADVVRGG